MDMRVGKLDACVGNFWVTPERLSIIAFSQPFGQDRMYLVAPKEPVPDGFAGACVSLLRLRECYRPSALRPRMLMAAL